MNLDFTEEQKMLKTTARDFLQTECPKELVRKLEESEEGYSPELWRKMAELGWLGLLIPEEYGGIGMNFLDLVVLLEEMGYNILPGPFFSTVIGTLPILAAGTEEQKQEYLPKIAEGDLKLTLAITEPSATYDPAGITVKAVPYGGDYILNGTKLFVENAHIADFLICAAKTGEGANPAAGITLFLVDANSAGVKSTVIPTTGLDKQGEVCLENLRVPGKNVLGEVDKGWEILKGVLAKAAVARCAEMLGGMQASLEMTNAYVKERIAYGRPLAYFQVLQHYLAAAWVKVETARNVTYEAAWLASQPDQPYEPKASVAKAYVGEAFPYVTERCVQVHGAIGMTREHDIGLYYRRAKAWDLSFGDSTYQRELVARELFSGV